MKTEQLTPQDLKALNKLEQVTGDPQKAADLYERILRAVRLAKQRLEKERSDAA